MPTAPTISPSQPPLMAAAAIERRRLIKRLRALDAAEAHDLADVLATCTDQHPCLSAACPVCGRAFQRAAIDLQEREIAVPARAIRNRRHLLTIVPNIGCVSPDALTPKLYLRVRHAIEAALLDCDLPPNLFALDVSFNEDQCGRLPPHWCVHGHGIGLNWLPTEKVKALQALFPATAYVSKPVVALQLDHEDEAPLYAYKAERVRKVKPKKNESHPSRPKPSRYALRSCQSAKLALVEHVVGYRGRLIGHKIDEAALERICDAFEWARDGP